jgi:hypothetical protein
LSGLQKTILEGSHIGNKREESFAVYVNQSVYHFGCAKDEGIEFEERYYYREARWMIILISAIPVKNASSMIKALDQAKH